MSVYTIRFCAVFWIQTELGGGYTTHYTAPDDGNTYVVRDVVLANMVLSDALLVVGIQFRGVSSPAWFLGGQVSAGAVLHYSGRQVLEPGETIQMYVDPAKQASLYVTGYKLGP